MLQQLLSAIKISALALVLSFGLSFALAWTPPQQLPPDGNASAPINVSATPQTKVGGDICTTVSGTTKCLQTSLDTGPTAQTKSGALTVGGVTTNTLRVSTGAAVSRVLTSDATGNATWQAAAGGSDNLGNHTATQALNMSGYGISNVGGITAAGEVDATGGTGTGYSTAPIEVRTTLTPRLAFHWPGVVASQIGMNSAGTIRTYDNPGTGYAPFAAERITATNGIDVGSGGSGNYTYLTLRDNDESPNGVKYIHANSNLVGFLGGAGSWLSYWTDAGNQENTGSVSATDVTARTSGKSLSQAWTGNFEIISATSAITYTRSHVGKVLIVYQGNAFQGGNSTLGWWYYFNGAVVDAWSGGVNYQVMHNHTWYHTAVVNGNFTVRLDVVPNILHNQIIIYYL